MSPNRTYRKTVPLNSLIVFLVGVFLLFSTIGFATDISDMGRQPQLRFLLTVLGSGIFPVFYAFAGFALRKDWCKAVVPIFVVHFAFMFFLGNKLPDRPQPSMMGPTELDALNHHLFLDALAIFIAVVLGYTCFLYVSITEFRRYFRLNAEIELASEIHRVLVPAINTQVGGFEFYGSSLPSGQVGGDLIDLAGTSDACRSAFCPRENS